MLDLSILNSQQKLAVETTEGPLLVLAGAGSGKTRVLIYRIAYILDAGLAGPENILAMTFTNKAAGEMKERISKVLKENDKENGKENLDGNIPWMGTFHSICVRILKIYGNRIGIGNNFSIYDSDDQLSAIKEAMKRTDISQKEFNPKAIAGYISFAKNELVEPEEYESIANGYFQQIVSRVYPEYQAILKSNNALDFDDLIMMTIKLLKNDSEVLNKLQDNFRYVLVDEYQDTNHAQYILVNLFAGKHRNLCCVGDDDQSIYSFRGATIQNILSFEKDYKSAKIIKLEQNYRSTKKILEASHQVISKNKDRRDKKLWTDNSEGNNIILYTANDEKDEGKWIVETIETLSTDYSLSEFAILYRTNAQSRSLEEAFIRSGIPYRIIGGVKFYERKEIKDVIAYLKSLYNPKDNKSIERIINVPKRGIGDKSFSDLVRFARSKQLGALEYLLNEDLNLINPKFAMFAKMMKDFKNKSTTLNIVDFINYILEHSGYIKMLEDGTLENESRIENIKELISVASKYLNEENGLEKFLDEVSLLEEDRSKTEGNESVTLMTIHAAKGLEFKYVFVAGVEENLFPHSNSLFDAKEMEEERRLAYVAITRAKEQLYLTHANTRIYFGSMQNNALSRFVSDIDPELLNQIKSAKHSESAWNEYDEDLETEHFKVNIDLKKGDKVKHDYFGVGTIKYIDSDLIEIDFGPAYGMKELMLEYAKLKKI